MIDSINSSMNAMIWSNALEIFEQNVNRPTYDTWFKSTELVAYYGDKIIVRVQNDFTKKMLSQSYYDMIKNCLESLLNQNIQIKFVTPQEQEEAIAKLFEENGYKDDDFLQENQGQAQSFITAPPAQKPVKSVIDHNDSNNNNYEIKDSGLNSKYTFDNFVIGNSNRMTHAACRGVADNISSNADTRIYNPLFIYGGAGLGKTHLMHAIGNDILTHQPKTKIKYITSENFMNELIDGIRNNTNTEFRNKYRNVDVLLIDDIQFLAKKESTQEEFFHTFNTLYEANKQIIISSDKPPNEIPKLEERLRTRFAQGLPTDIQPPDFETRIAILKKKAEDELIEIDSNVFEYIAENVQSNIRELEGILVRISAYSKLNHMPIDLETAKKCLETLITPNESVKITGELIQEKVAEYYQIRMEDFKAKRRTKDIAYPRQIAMYLCREMTDLSLPKIGDMFGGRDHSTVIHAYDKIALEMKNDPTLQITINKIKSNVTDHK